MTRCILSSDRGASAVEYGLIVAAVAALVVVMVFAFGGATQELFSDSCTAIDSAVSASANCAP